MTQGNHFTYLLFENDPRKPFHLFIIWYVGLESFTD